VRKTIISCVQNELRRNFSGSWKSEDLHPSFPFFLFPPFSFFFFVWFPPASLSAHFLTYAIFLCESHWDFFTRSPPLPQALFFYDKGPRCYRLLNVVRLPLGIFFFLRLECSHSGPSVSVKPLPLAIRHCFLSSLHFLLPLLPQTYCKSIFFSRLDLPPSHSKFRVALMIFRCFYLMRWKFRLHSAQSFIFLTHVSCGHCVRWYP